jgi:hypothetical protein
LLRWRDFGADEADVVGQPTLYICWGLFRTPRPGHPCRNAYDAIKAAGLTPTIVRCYGWGLLPGWLNRSRGRREVRRLTGTDWVPVLVTEDRRVIAGGDAIRDWVQTLGS